MKFIVHIILLFAAFPSFAQPTGNQKLFLEIIDNGDTIQFKKEFKNGELGSKKTLTQKAYQLNDISGNQTGFSFYPRDEFIHKTLMNNQHRIQIVKNNADTMTIEILNASNRYFLSIPFQKGNFRLIVNDGKLHMWNYNTLRYQRVTEESFVYDITPLDWTVFQVSNQKTEKDYFVSAQFEKQQLLEKLVNPEDDPNFRNPRRAMHLRKEVEDYNFDGQKDYRERKLKDSTKWNYFIYRDAEHGFVLDTLLSSMDVCEFNFEAKTMMGSKVSKPCNQVTQYDTYQLLDGRITLIQQMKCEQVYPNSEKIDCSVYVLENGEWIFKKMIKGSE